MSKEFWQNSYRQLNIDVQAEYQPWMDAEVLAGLDRSQALDLGCGLGMDSHYLRQQGFTVYSADQSEEALARGRQLGWIAAAMPLDFKRLDKNLFDPGQLSLVVASLSLHYFPADTVREIMNKLMLWLKPGGVFYSRFNSIKDSNFGAQNADANGYWHCPDQGLKVFYTPNTLADVMQDFGQPNITETTIQPYGKTKQVLECWFVKT